MKKERVEYTADGRKIIVLSDKEYNKWVLEHLEEVYPELSKEEIARIRKEEEEYKNKPFYIRLIRKIKDLKHSFLIHFSIIKWDIVRLFRKK